MKIRSKNKRYPYVHRPRSLLFPVVQTASMNIRQIVDELKQTARQMGFIVRLDNGRFRGGRCTVSGEKLIVLNKRQLPETHLVILAESLRGLPTDELFLRPAVRKALEEVWLRRPQSEVEDDLDLGG